MDKENLPNYLLKILHSYIEDNDIDVEVEVDINTRLIGTDSILDSIGLVTFVVEVEQAILEDHSIDVELASEKAMSRTTSPFISIKTLSKFISEEFL